MITGWQGDLAEAERLAVLCRNSSHLIELAEFCHICFGMYAVEIVRGRPEHALAWLTHALDRVRPDGRAPAIVGLIEQAAYATLVGMGQSARADALRLRLASVDRTPLQPGSYFHLLSFQSRALLDIARGDLGSGFDDDVDEFCRLRIRAS